MPDIKDPEHLVQMKAHATRMMQFVPWAKELGFHLTELERGRAVGRLPWSEHLVGDPRSGIVHGGVITSLLDNLCGAATVSALDTFMSTATLDLRIDYMRPADKGRDIIGEAECYHVTRTVAFTRAWAFHDNRNKVIATAAGAFALNDPSAWASGLSNAIEKDKAP
ncbi:MAG: PaaI family thioesterase [Pseudomonadota bacterium]